MTMDLILLSISLITLASIIIAIARKREKGQIHYIFITFCSMLAVWCIINIQHLFVNTLTFYPVWVLFEYIVLGTVGPLSISIARVFFISNMKLNLKFWLTLLIPAIISLTIPFNDNIHFFFTKYAFDMTYGQFGLGGWIFLAYTYTCIIIGISMMVYHSIKEAGFFSKQALLIVIGSLVPLLLNTLYTTKIVDIGPNATPITFTVFTTFVSFAMFKFKLLSIEPIALQKVVDHMTDAFVIVNDKNKIVDYNKVFDNAIGQRVKFQRNEDILEVFGRLHIATKDIETLKDYIDRAIKKKDTLVFTRHVQFDTIDRHIDVEITPIYSGNRHIGTIILVKDITSYVESIQTIKDYQAMLEKNLEQIAQDKKELLIRNAVTEQMARTDVLTDMYNHRTFQEYFDAILNQIHNYGGLLQLAVLDIDNFKQINDTFGHAIGDIVLKRISSKIKEMVTANDIPARYGGEEFVIIFNGKSLEDAFKIVELLRRAIQREKYREIDRPITVSIGLCTYSTGDTKEKLFNKADKALYEAKHQGKNQTVIAG